MRKLKKMIGIVLTLAMVMCMSATVFAADYSITITNAAEGETYEAYKIFDVTYNESGNYSYTIDSGSVWYSTVEAATDIFTLGQINGTTTYNVTVNPEVSDEAIIAVFTGADIDLDSVEADAKATGSDDEAVLEVSTAGYYFVTTTLGSLVMIDTTHPTAEIKEKNGIPSITKTERDVTFDEADWIGEGEYDTSANKDTMEYRLIVADIHDASNLVIHDYLDSQLVQSTVEIESITIVDGYTRITLSAGNGDYTYSTDTCGGKDCDMNNCSFEIAINSDILKGLSDGAYLEIIYEVEIDEDSSLFDEDLTDEIDNYANVTFGAAGKGTPSEVETFSFGFNVFKYTGDEKNPLAGAKFALKNEDGKYAKFVEEGANVYLLDEWVESIDDATEIETPDNGRFTVEGLHDGTYFLEETEAPEGYNKLTGDVTVAIDATGAVTVDNESASDKTANVENKTGSMLPGTGGMGTTIFYVIGVILVLGAAILLVTRRRMANAE